MSDIANKLIERIRDFTERLESGEPIPVTIVERHNTPDGPMHVRRVGAINPKQDQTSEE